MHLAPAIVYALIIWAEPTVTLTGYDCGAEGLNITSLSLTNIAECQIDDTEPKTEEIYLQLMQFSDFTHTEAIQCRVEVDRTVYRCGMFSHVSVVPGGKHNYIKEITVEACKRAQEIGTLIMGNDILIDDLKKNSTTSRSLTLAGTLQSDGTCQGGVFSDPFGTWENAVVQASLRITLKNFEVPIKAESDEVILPSGARCKATTWECLDTDGSKTFWKTVPKGNCNFEQYNILYDGMAHKLLPSPGQENGLTIYTVTTSEATFALAKTSESNHCGYRIVHTEHPKLFLLETTRGRTFKEKTKVSTDNLDMFAYVNSKFIYIERHMKNQLTKLYKDIMTQKCALEKQVLENALSLASIAPDEMAHRLMKNPGYTAITSGEVIYIIKCIPVVCKLRQAELCYNELPVTYNNASYFLTPRSHILTRAGTPRECNELLPPMYNIEDTWFKMMPRPVESVPPPTIRPLTKPNWKYVNPSSLATSGIYSTEDLDRLRNHIMFPVEKMAIVNTIAHGAVGGKIPSGTISLYNMLDEESLEKIAENAGSRLWKGFITFGSASAGILSIILLIRLAKLIVDSIIRGYAIHSIYGWSLHILGAVWSSLTHLLIHLGGRKTPQQPVNQSEDETVREILVQPREEPGISAKNSNNESEENTLRIASAPVVEYRELNKYLRGNDPRE